MSMTGIPDECCEVEKKRKPTVEQTIDGIKNFQRMLGHQAFVDYQTIDLMDDVIELLKEQRPKGNWIISNQKNAYGGVKITCSHCDDSVIVQNVQDELFCRHCGAYMRTVADG